MYASEAMTKEGKSPSADMNGNYRWKRTGGQRIRQSFYLIAKVVDEKLTLQELEI